MAQSKTKWSFEQVMQSLKQARYAPLYGLMGEENYFMDQISHYIEQSILTEEEKEFNLTLLYGNDITYTHIVEAVRRYPLGAPYNIVIVKEAQACNTLNKLVPYLSHPSPSTILVLNHRYGKFDKNLSAVIEKNGVLFESKKLYPNQVPEWIYHTLQHQGYTIDAEAAEFLAAFVGEDLTKIQHELDKLIIALKPQKGDRIALKQIRELIGYSKELTPFDFCNAILRKDVLTANRMIYYFRQNGKKGFFISTVAVLFNTFSLLVEAYSLPNRSREQLMNNLGITAFKAREIETGLNKYNPMQAVKAISLLREYDSRAKGAQGNAVPDADLLSELAYKLMH